MMKRMSKIWFLSLMFILLWAMSGCNNNKPEEMQPTEELVQEIPSSVATPEQEVQKASSEPESQEEPSSKSVIEYGDKITVSYTRTTQELQWEYTGTQEFQVATTSAQFQNELDTSEEAAMKQVEEAIGKTVGDTFTLWYEGGDGLYGYEYTIVEVKSQNPDVAEYGDKLLADYSMKHYGVDTCEGKEIHTGQLPLHLLNTNAFFAIEDEDGCCSLRQGDLELKKILGKTIGDQFKSGNSYYENSFSYQFMIKEIHKAVKYGDTRVAEVRETNTLDAKSYEEHSEGEWLLDLGMRDGLDSLDGEPLSLENIRTLYKELIGKKAGNRAFFVRENRETREIYDIMIHDVAAYESEETGDDMELLIMAEEDMFTKFYRYFVEYGEYYSEPDLEYIVIEDKNTQMFYEYDYDYYSDFYLYDKYEYTAEYDEKGRLVKETIRGSENLYDKVFEYKYNEQGICIEIIKYAPGYELHYYYDDSGNPINSKYISDDDRSVEYDYPY
ncbi:MAG: hypothetical protein IKY53_00975 [Lachnospiraceae bacterium]|nr:hypothetical protein [Lachnospiraceae bacterium]